MSLTRATAEGMILSRCQLILTQALGAAVVPATVPAPSPNAFLGWPISAALMDCNVTPADPSNPLDAEVGLLLPRDYPKFWDCGEYHALVSGQALFLQTSVTTGNVSFSDSDIGRQVQAAVEFKAQQIRQRYGVGNMVQVGGTIAVGQIGPYTPRPHVPPGQNWRPPWYGWGRL